ncbi:MAG: RtcB family protein [Deltaproteobacteria bacterium]|nr:RtcB family protein [Deltaproteobacteria bacterium]
MNLERITDTCWRLPQEGKMRVDGIIYSSRELLKDIQSDESLKQVANVACLPGIVKASLAMPDIHWGYGFPIGGVAAFDPDDGVVSPGGVGYDINCGVRLLRTELEWESIKDKMKGLIDQLFRDVPTGVGSHRRDLRLNKKELADVARKGARWAVERNEGDGDDLDHIEEHGCIAGADPEVISDRAYDRGSDQVGTLGSGNHFAEVQVVDEIFDEAIANGFGLFKGQITVSIHCGSRGFGHQVCQDSIDVMLKAARKYGIELPDPQLCCAPISSPEAKRYLAAMAGAANFAFANRQVITHGVREAFGHHLHMTPRDLGIKVVYDVCHNIAKFEEHCVGGVSRRVLVHRKGATRAFPGQPVLIPGDMGRYSFVLVGTQKALDETFGSTCHGAGRLMSRHKAKRACAGRDIVKELADQGIIVRGASHATVVEEAPFAYKDVASVVDVVQRAGISKIVARLRPVGVIKG